jgi:2-polyprenyl-3-methyl-5-hydroxy-6-metoxy-1,4-benzoquinol methylase
LGVWRSGQTQRPANESTSIPRRQSDITETVRQARFADEETHRAVAKMRRHWWYRGREVAVASLLRRAGVRPGTRVLDFGCGTGHMGAVLSRYGTLVGVEGSSHAIEAGDFADYGEVLTTCSLDAPAFPVGPFDLIALLDVLEHIPDDTQTLSRVAGLLVPGGAVVVSVPMDPEIFCEVDEQAGHVRRYTRTALETLASDAGLEIVARTGYVVALLPLAKRQRRRVIAGKAMPDDEMRVPFAPVNGVLASIVRLEGIAIRWLELPEGLSMIAVMRPTSPSRSGEGE